MTSISSAGLARSAGGRASPARSASSPSATTSSTSPCRPVCHRGRRARPRATPPLAPAAPGRARRSAARRRSTDLEADDLTCRPPPALRGQRVAPDEGSLVRRDQPTEAKFERRVALLVDRGLSCAVKIHVDEQEPGLDTRHVECQHARRPARRRRGPPTSAGPRRRARDPTASRSRSPGRRYSRYVRFRPARRRCVRAVTRKYFSEVDVGFGGLPQQSRRRRPLHGQRRHLLGDVLDLHVEARARSAGTSAGSGRRMSSARPDPRVAPRCRRRSPCRAHRTRACRSPARPTSLSRRA